LYWLLVAQNGVAANVVLLTKVTAANAAKAIVKFFIIISLNVLVV
tara:strand:- start:318 stop:452 length:135 start_codon:yes stop_codon:yes gene_type:complete